jgi:thiol:disulfide interchange protein
MEPAMTQFESNSKKTLNLVSINVDQTDTPEYKKYAPLLEKLSQGSIPLTVWIDDKGKVLDQAVGAVTEKDLLARSQKATKLAK